MKKAAEPIRISLAAYLLLKRVAAEREQTIALLASKAIIAAYSDPRVKATGKAVDRTG